MTFERFVASVNDGALDYLMVAERCRNYIYNNMTVELDSVENLLDDLVVKLLDQYPNIKNQKPIIKTYNQEHEGVDCFIASFEYNNFSGAIWCAAKDFGTEYVDFMVTSRGKQAFDDLNS